MSEQELVQALRELIFRHAPPLQPREFSAEIIRRDRGRMRWLAGLTLLLWLVGIGGVQWTLYWGNRALLLDEQRMFWQSGDSHHQAIHRALGAYPPSFDDLHHAKRELHHCLEADMFLFGPALLVAALCTIWLVFSSRQATLKQLAINLAEISEQFKQMRREGKAEGAARS
jgi:hypothetical protein